MKDETKPTRPTSATDPKPAGYWVVKVVIGIAIAVYSAIGMFTEQEVSAITIAALGSIAAGPEFVTYLRKGGG